MNPEYVSSTSGEAEVERVRRQVETVRQKIQELERRTHAESNDETAIN